MKACRSFGRWVAAGLVFAAVPVLGQTTDAPKAKNLKPNTSTAKASAPMQKASGVIVKVEPVMREASKGAAGKRASKKSPIVARRVRLTINTAAVWRDWVRDQASTEAKTPREAAVDGKKSVATTGEPTSPDTAIVIDLGPDATIETRYRSSTDEISEGAKTPEKAAEAERKTDPADTSKSVESKGAKTGTALAFTLDDLKPGLYVEVDYRHVQASDRGTKVCVVRPIGGANIPAAVEAPKVK